LNTPFVLFDVDFYFILSNKEMSAGNYRRESERRHGGGQASETKYGELTTRAA
jgi:hypothetical protein